MTEEVRDDMIDRQIQDFLASQATEIAGAPSAIQVAAHIAARANRRPTSTWGAPSFAWIVLTGLLLAALVGAALVGASLFRKPPGGPFNGLIAVSANPPGMAGVAGDIYVVARDEAARRIIGSDGDGIAQACPRFSPDGLSLAFGEARSSADVTTFRGEWPVSDRAVAVVGVDGHGDPSPSVVRVTVGDTTGPIPCPEWSPNSEYVAFRVDYDLWIADASSGAFQVIPLNAEPGSERKELEWSRDSSMIAVSEPGQILLINLDGDTRSAIPAIGGAGGAPLSIGWTADDQKIIYISTDRPGDGLAVVVVNADGRNALQLSPTSDELQLRFYDAVVSPAGDRVAFAVGASRCSADADGNESCSGAPQPIIAMGIDGSNVIELPISLGFGRSGLQWSPDGGQLLYSSLEGVTSTLLTLGAEPVIYSPNELNLEWSRPELTWQPTYE
ncbi:MAG: hypothetical protein QOJ81_2263 [Chloroflexota bacterium]|jgi:Tol biopolymer transport system component|nr:hypothetical protein [Chloroflexota bacterium]